MDYHGDTEERRTNGDAMPVTRFARHGQLAGLTGMASSVSPCLRGDPIPPISPMPPDLK